MYSQDQKECEGSCHGVKQDDYTPSSTTTSALKIRSVSMSPRYKPGEYVEFSPDKRAKPGDDVVVQLKNGITLVRHFVVAHLDHDEFLAIGPGTRSTIHRAAITALYPIVGQYPRASGLADILDTQSSDNTLLRDSDELNDL